MPACSLSLQKRLKFTRSKFVHQIAHAHPQGLGDTQKRMKTDPLLTAFDLADVNGMQVGFFCEPFLAHARSIAAVSDRFAKDFELLFGPRHGCLGKQDGQPWNTPNMGLFAAVALPDAGMCSSNARSTHGAVCSRRRVLR